MFHDGYFSLIMYDTAGNFLLAAAVPFEINGNMCKEFFPFHSDTNFINCKDWQKWEMPDGKVVTWEWNASGKFIEKRVRVK